MKTKRIHVLFATLAGLIATSVSPGRIPLDKFDYPEIGINGNVSNIERKGIHFDFATPVLRKRTFSGANCLVTFLLIRFRISMEISKLSFASGRIKALLFRWPCPKALADCLSTRTTLAWTRRVYILFAQTTGYSIFLLCPIILQCTMRESFPNRAFRITDRLLT